MATDTRIALAAAAAALAAASYAVTVREGFVVAFTEKVKQGDKIVSREQAYYPEDGTVTLPADRVLEHAHKLEPADAEAQKFLEQLHVKFDKPADTGAPDPAAVATAVVAALAALGIDSETLAALAAAKAGKAKAATAPAAPAGGSAAT